MRNKILKQVQDEDIKYQINMITVISPFVSEQQNAEFQEYLLSLDLITKVCFVSDNLCQTDTLKRLSTDCQTPYLMIIQKPNNIRFVYYATNRMMQIMEDTGSVMTYSDHFLQKEGNIVPAPVIDYQQGSLRDDFNFGSVWLLRSECVRQAVAQMSDTYAFAGLYDLRLRLSEQGEFVHINEFLYYDVENDLRRSGEKQFDYVNPKNREVQIEMEKACTEHLKRIGAFLPAGRYKNLDLTQGDFPFEASVIIPCKNRVRTIADAIRSALNQKTSFKYNVIVVDDNSTDGTVDVIKSFLTDEKLVYIAQDKTWHAIGGNWNAALHHPQCGRFALQLDSDDMYYDENTVQQFVDAFYREQCAMVVGTYRITDFNLNELPPGIIDHREWTEENGRNNALRINGLGAPRGFFTPLLRQLNFPTTKYGEDYAVGLRVSRHYRIGRIYNVLYNCRRWDDNSDANIDIDATNRNNLYKDRLRTWELKARQKELSALA